MIAGSDGLIAGSLPQWGAFVALVGILARQVIPWRKLSIESGAALRKELLIRLDELKNEHRECLERMEQLQNTIYGIRRQHIQEQISLINIIIKAVDAPQLKIMLSTLESVQVALRAEGAQDGNSVERA